MKLGQGSDIKGKAMEHAVVSEFLGETPGTTANLLAPKDPVELAAFHRLPESKQRDSAFQLMRRAGIRFERKRITQEHKEAVPPRDDTSDVSCEADVAVPLKQRLFKTTLIRPGLSGVPEYGGTASGLQEPAQIRGYRIRFRRASRSKRKI